ncbi:MAG TPA: metal-dependent hydrolase [Candidatus Acidoferrum sp.]|nr:metal-dependent hydrolase [Candidatus Acidoferrum sp.]
MDALTHGLASYSITRAAFPRASRTTLTAAILAGAAADLDRLSEYIGPSAFLDWHRTATHSIVGTLVIAAAFLVAASLTTRHELTADPIRTVFLALLAACSLHVAMDLSQNASVQVLWPFRAQRYSADWVAHFDLWILLIFLAGVLLPQLLALVTEEIGAKSKAPRGRIGAIIALLGVFIYIGTRLILHGNAVAMMEARTYRGEVPRRVAAFAESDSPLHWHGIVETERAFHDLDLNLAPGSSFNPDAATISYKPEPSAPLEAAGRTESVRRFLQAAKFPKATVEKTNTGYRVQIRDLAEQREARSGPRVIAIVETDPNAKVLSDELAWDQKM